VLYKSAQWQRLRRAVLQTHPLCVRCLDSDQVTIATDVDHIVPHRGDPARFWDRENLQPLCHACHSVKTRGE